MAEFGPLMFQDDTDARRAEQFAIDQAVLYLMASLPSWAIGRLAGALDQKMLVEWAAARAEPSDEQQQQLRVLLYMVWRLERSRPHQLVWAWFYAKHPMLGGKAPVVVLQYDRSDSLDDAQLAVMAALRETLERPPRTE